MTSKGVSINLTNYNQRKGKSECSPTTEIISKNTNLIVRNRMNIQKFISRIILSSRVNINFLLNERLKQLLA